MKRKGGKKGKTAAPVASADAETRPNQAEVLAAAGLPPDALDTRLPGWIYAIGLFSVAVAGVVSYRQYKRI